MKPDFMALCFGLLPLTVVFWFGLFTTSIHGRDLHPWASARALQCLDVKLQDWGTGFVGPVLTELFSGAVHAILVFGAATFITWARPWRWELAALTCLLWVAFAVKRARRFVARRDGLRAEQSAERSCLTDATLKNLNWPAGAFLVGVEIVTGSAKWWY